MLVVLGERFAQIDAWAQSALESTFQSELNLGGFIQNTTQAGTSLQWQQKATFLCSGINPFRYQVALGQTDPERSKGKNYARNRTASELFEMVWEEGK